MTFLAGLITSEIMAYVAGTAGAFLLAWLLKKIPNDKIKLAVGKVAYSAGVAVTLGLSKWKVTAKFWNKVAEPWFIDLIDNVIGEAVKEFIRGLRSDG